MPRRAKDKLAESRFFLERLRGADPASDDFRYLLSALANAARSVTWVLQADLRGDHGESFDTWWKEARSRLGKGELSFKVLTELRNTMTKRGNRLPIRMLALDFDQGLISRLEVRKEQLTTSKSVELRMSLRPGEHGVEGGGLLADVDSEEFSEAIAELTGGAVTEASEILAGLELNAEGFLLSESSGVLSDEEVVRAFQEYLAELAELLTDAEAKFPSKGWDGAI